MDLEQLVTSPAGFGIESATLLQRAICRLIDGVPLDDLLSRGTQFERDTVTAALGCDPTGHVQATEVLFLGPVRTFKTILSAAIALRANQTADVSIVKSGQEPPRYSALSTHVDSAQAMRGHLEIVRSSPALRGLYVGDTTDGIVTRHPTGLQIETKVLAGHRGGYSLASRWSTGVGFMEAPGWHSTDKVVSLEENRETALGRLLPGAQIFYEGSPWQPSGLAFDMHHDHFGRPSADVMVIAPQMVGDVTPATQLNPVYWTAERVEKIRRTSRRTFDMHVSNQFGSPERAAFRAEDIEPAFRPLPNSRGYHYHQPVAILDPSSGKSDVWAWAIAQWVWPTVPDDAFEMEHIPLGPGVHSHDKQIVRDAAGRPKIRADYTGETRPFLLVRYVNGLGGRFFGDVSGDDLVDRVARDAVRYGARSVVSDQRESLMLESAFRRRRFRFFECPWTGPNKVAAVERTRRWLADRLLVLPAHGELRKQLYAFPERLTAEGGFTYGARNGADDYAALILTLALADMDGLLDGSPLQRGSKRRIESLEARQLGAA